MLSPSLISNNLESFLVTTTALSSISILPFSFFKLIKSPSLSTSFGTNMYPSTEELALSFLTFAFFQRTK